MVFVALCNPMLLVQTFDVGFFILGSLASWRIRLLKRFDRQEAAHGSPSPRRGVTMDEVAIAAPSGRSRQHVRAAPASGGQVREAGEDVPGRHPGRVPGSPGNGKSILDLVGLTAECRRNARPGGSWAGRRGRPCCLTDLVAARFHMTDEDGRR